MEKRGNFFGRHWGKMTAIATAGGAIALAPEAIAHLQDVRHPESAIVTGVPGQVESHYSNTRCASYFKFSCLSYTTDYYLGIEQCTADLISATHEAQQNPSFNPAVGVMAPGCYYDSVFVSLHTWQAYADGSTITFDGPVGENLHK